LWQNADLLASVSGSRPIFQVQRRDYPEVSLRSIDSAKIVPGLSSRAVRLSWPKPPLTADGIKLGSWVTNNRKRRKFLSNERIARLDALGFDWKSRHDGWWEEEFEQRQE